MAETVDAALGGYREAVLERLLGELRDRPHEAYALVSDYPARPGKGLRPALCLATCAALGGDPTRALNSAVAIELFHNAFLVHDDIQDESESRRGGPALHAAHGVGIALNAGNATNLIGLQRVMANRRLLGPRLSWRVFAETELMLRHSLEGQATELGWIAANACDLTPADYYRMCLKKTSWYTCLYPLRVGAVVARGAATTTERLDTFGWYLGAAFQITDDVLNLTADYAAYGKEIGGDIYEGKRTLMLIDLLRTLRGRERERVVAFLALRRSERAPDDVAWVHRRMIETGCIDRARADARELAAAAYAAGEEAFAGVEPSPHLDFLLGLPAYVVERER